MSDEPRRRGRPRKQPTEITSLVSQYVNHGVRTPETRAAWAEYIRERRQQRSTAA